MKGFQRLAAITAVFVFAFATPAQAGELSTDDVLREVQEQIEIVKEWVADRIEGMRMETQEPEPLGKNVTLEFSIEGEDDTFAISTATSSYMLSRRWSESSEKEEGPYRRSKTSEYAIDVSGTISPGEPDGGLLVSCAGSLQNIAVTRIEFEETVEESVVEFDASAVFRSGEKRVITAQGEVKLMLQVTINR